MGFRCEAHVSKRDLLCWVPHLLSKIAFDSVGKISVAVAVLAGQRCLEVEAVHRLLLAAVARVWRYFRARK